jgi:hypothetical protein
MRKHTLSLIAGLLLASSAVWAAGIVHRGLETFDNFAVTGGVTRAHMSAAAARKAIQCTSATIATTSTTDCYVIAPEAGTLASVDFTPLVALTTDDTNFITWTITNLGQAGAGSTAMLATSPAGTNTTKTTGGAALAISTVRALTLSGTGSALVVASGDLLRIRATASGTLANTVTVPVYLVRFTGTT